MVAIEDRTSCITLADQRYLASILAAAAVAQLNVKRSLPQQALPAIYNSVCKGNALDPKHC